MTIAELTTEIAAVVDYSGSIRFDPTMPDSLLRKLLSSSKHAALHWRPYRTIDDGLAQAVGGFREIADRELRPQ